MNPDPDVGAHRVTGIDGARAVADEALGLESLAVECRLSPLRRSEISTEILDATTDWTRAARANDISGAEINRFKDTFTTGIRVLRGLAS